MFEIDLIESYYMLNVLTLQFGIGAQNDGVEEMILKGDDFWVF